MKKKLCYGLGILILLTLIIGAYGIHYIAPYAITKPFRSNLIATPEDYGVQSTAFQIKVEENINLDAYWIASNTKEVHGVIIMVHGVGGNKEHFLELGSTLADQGIETILFDGRAHGKSGGTYCTYGFYEKIDIKHIVDYIQQKRPGLSIGIWGNSLGGAIAIQALEYDPRIVFGIIESTFISLEQIVFDYKKRYLKGIGIRFLSDYALKRAGHIANFDPEQVSPIASVKNIIQPVLIAHGNADKRISYTYGQALYEDLKSVQKEFILVQGAGHLNLGQKGGEAYRQQVFAFIARQWLTQ